MPIQPVVVLDVVVACWVVACLAVADSLEATWHEIMVVNVAAAVLRLVIFAEFWHCLIWISFAVVRLPLDWNQYSMFWRRKRDDRGLSSS